VVVTKGAVGKRSQGSPERITIERTYPASVEEVWELWTTKEGIEAWWAPDGFKAPNRLAYSSLVDFVPGVEPYEQATEVRLTASPEGVNVVMTAEPMHNEEWTQRLVMGRSNELDNLARLLAAS
jgi:hypothetical protein